MSDKATPNLEFLSWLVESRSNNQRSTLKLYQLVTASRVVLENDPALFEAAQELVAIAFSLWRAVFLNDLDESYEKQSANLESFLLNLIAHNSIQYSTDVQSREWSFWYYFRNATSRLKKLPEIVPGIAADGLLDRAESTAKQQWNNAQAVLDRAIDDFATSIASRR